MSEGSKARPKAQPNRFVEDAREMGLDTDEANAEFERAFGKIAPPKKKGDVPPKDEKNGDG